MRKPLASAVMALALTALMAVPVLASTDTRTFVGHKYTLTCTTTYTESGGDSTRVDTLKELRSITDISCSLTKNP